MLLNCYTTTTCNVAVIDQILYSWRRMQAVEQSTNELNTGRVQNLSGLGRESEPVFCVGISQDIVYDV